MEKAIDIKERDYFHYATQETMCSMLNKYRENKAQGYLIFWASSIFTMSDSQKTKHGFEVFKVLVPFNNTFMT